MIRQSELEEMEKKWAEENARIMKEHPPHVQTLPSYSGEHEMLPLGGPPTQVEPSPRDDQPTLPLEPGAESPAGKP
jgi:sec-independent protein translocase protein TatB